MTSRQVRTAAEEHFLAKGDKLQWEGCENDPHAAYKVLRGPITHYAYQRLGKDWMDAEDATQEAYVQVLRTAKVNDLFNFGGLYKIWLDRSISKIKAEKRMRGMVIDEDTVVDPENGTTLIDLAEGTEADPQFLIDTQERVNLIMSVSNNMSHRAKAIVRLHVLFGYTYREISDMIDLPVRKIQNTVAYFRRILGE